MDASTDGTPETIEEIARQCTREVVLLRQTRERGRSGLGAAVVQGLRAARAPWVCVMDADLQHPPELIASLLEQAESSDLDLVVASRYCEDGSTGFGWARAMASRSTTGAARLLFPRRLRNVTDPMSGFFLVRRDAIDVDALRPRGFKILLELLIRTPGAPVRRGVVRVRRTSRRSQQGDDPRGAALPVAARAPAVRPLRNRRRLGSRRQHPPAGGADRRRRPVLRRVGGHRDPGVDVVELLLHRALGLRRSRAQARQGPPHGALLPHEQRRRSR